MAMVFRFLWLSLIVPAFFVASCGDNIGGQNTIADYIQSESRFSSLQKILEDANFLSTLDKPGPYTLFAFTNGASDLGSLHPQQKAQLAGYHIYAGEISEETLKRRTAINTLEGDEIHVRYGLRGILLNDGTKFMGESIEVDNGVIHLIDQALMRPVLTQSKIFQGGQNIALEGLTKDSIVIEESGFIHDLRISVEIDQEQASGLSVYLSHKESARGVVLAQSPRTNLSHMKVLFADGAEYDVVNDVIRVGGEGEAAFPQPIYRPLESLELMSGEMLAGEWELLVFSYPRNGNNGTLLNWSLTATVGPDKPSPAIVLNRRLGLPAAMAQEFNESITVAARGTMGLEGAIKIGGSVGDLAANSLSFEASDYRKALIFSIPKEEEPGPREVVISAEQGRVSRILLGETKVVVPDANGIELLSQVPLSLLGAAGGSGNDIWGYTDPMTGAEIALVGTSQSTAFVDLSIPDAPVVLGHLPTEGRGSAWRDIKVYKDFAFIVSEEDSHGLQIFDLRQLRGVTSAQVFAVSARRTDFGSAHNIAINEDTALAYVVGSDYEGCFGGMLVYDISSPLNPVAISCFSGATTNGQIDGPAYPTDVYTHDVQCVVYNGPDSDYSGREICFSSDEKSVGVADFSNPASPSQIVRMRYESVGYTHQGWLTEDHKYFVMNDEFDEVDYGVNTLSYVWDMSDLDNPLFLGAIDNPSKAIGHNTYIQGEIAYMANYTSGLRMVDISPFDFETKSEAAYYDTYPDDDDDCRSPNDCGHASYDGAWSNYPFFASGIVVVSDIQRGLFVLRPTL